MEGTSKNNPIIKTMHIRNVLTTGKGILKFGTIEDFPLPEGVGDKGDFGFASMRSPGKNGARILGAFAVPSVLRVIFDKNPGTDATLTIRVDRQEK